MHHVEKCPICNGTNLLSKTSIKDYSISKEIFGVWICTNCQLLLTNPRPDENKQGEYYVSDSYISHTSKPNDLISRALLISRAFTLKHKLKIIKQHSPPGAVLDVGCGTGDFLRVLKKNSITAIGVEPSEAAREVGKQSGAVIYESLDKCQESNFTVITLWHVLEHLPNPVKALNTLSEKLNSDGTIFIAVPNHQSFDSGYYQKYWAGYDVPRHLFHFSRECMTQLVQVCNLKLVRTLPMKLDAYYVSLLSEKYKAQGKLTLSGLIAGVVTGLRSNLAARKSGNYSSLIYVIRK